MSQSPHEAPRRSWRRFVLRLVHLNVGLMAFGFSIALMLAAGVGLGPWDVFHQGAAQHLPITIGQVMVAAGLALLLVSMLLAGVRPGLGTVLNMALIGPWVDLFLAQPFLPRGEGWLDGGAIFATGLVMNGLATGLYITAGLGAGPRDGFALALAQRLNTRVRRARTGVEACVLLTGWLLGGTVGLGTLAFALAIGPLMQWGLRIMSGFERRYGLAGTPGVPAAPPVHDAGS
ncbi:MAG: hypothetical protein U5K81_13110 [Trueperaceae bacterium]|nr:hypothetical protein [Trueperaceae bacterium]